MRREWWNWDVYLYSEAAKRQRSIRAGMPVSPVFSQNSYRWRSAVPDPSGVDAAFDGSDVAAKTQIAWMPGVLIRGRVLIQQTESTAINTTEQATEFLLQYENVTQASGWNTVGAQGTSSEDVIFANATGFADGDNTTTQRIGSGSLVTGDGLEVNTSDTITFTTEALSETEIEFAILLVDANVADGDVIRFRFLYSSADETPPATVLEDYQSDAYPTIVVPYRLTDGAKFSDVAVGDTGAIEYSDSHTDGTNFGDSVDPVGVGDAVSDGAKFGDSVPVGVGTTISEGAQFGDSAGRSFEDALSEGADFGDTPVAGWNESVSDGAEFGDAIEHQGRTITDGAVFAEDITTAWTELAPVELTLFGDTAEPITKGVVSDGAKFGDSVPVAVATAVSDGAQFGDFSGRDFVDALSDGADFGDATATNVGDAVLDGADFGDVVGKDETAALSEGTDFGDTSAARSDFAASVSDGADFGDTPATAVATTVSDGAEFGDASSFSDTARTIVEGAKFGDTVPVGIGTTVSDGAEFGDSSAYEDVARTISEGTDFGDTSSARADFATTTSEGADFGDSVAESSATAVSDGAKFGDSSVPALTYVAAISDGAKFGDDSQRAGDTYAVTDGALFGEDFTTVWREIVSAEGAVFGDRASDSRAIVDGAKFGEDFTVTLTEDTGADGAVFGDTAHVSGQSLGVSDGAKFGDSFPLIVRHVYQTISDGAEFGDTSAGTIDLDLARTISDGAQFGDSAAGSTTYVWDETFEPVGYHESWSSGEQIVGAATVDEDADSPAGAPTWWEDKALRVTAPTGADRGYVLHTSGVGSNPICWATFGFYIHSESISYFAGSRFLLALRSATGTTVAIVYLVRDLGAGTPLQLIAQVEGSGVSNPRVVVKTGRFYLSELKHDQTSDAWEWWVNGIQIASGTIGSPADDGREIQWFDLGLVTATAGASGADVSIGRFTLSPERVGYLPSQSDDGAKFGDALSALWATSGALTDGVVMADEVSTPAGFSSTISEGTLFGDDIEPGAPIIASGDILGLTGTPNTLGSTGGENILGSTGKRNVLT